MLKLRKLERRELSWLLFGLAICVLLLSFLVLAGEVAEGNTHDFDVRVVEAFRSPLNPSRPIGPDWLPWVVDDITALGGAPVLGVILAAIVGFLLIQARYRTALFVTLTAASGELLSYALKQTFDRPRPTVVPDLGIMTPSFPSGHAMESAIVYLTLGAVLMRVAERRATKVYCLGIAIFLTTIIGISRVYLGAHYPTDVVAGWIVGFIWASLCWLVEQRLDTRAGIAAEREKDA